MSLISAKIRRENSVLITGHTNVKAATNKTKVKLHSDAVRVEDHIQLHHMGVLKLAWEKYGLALNRTQFRDAIHQVIGPELGSSFDQHATFLFKKMDTNQDANVDWDEFCTYLMIGMQEKDALNNERETPLMMCHDTFNQVHNSKIVKLQALANPIRFVSISEDGAVATYNMTMECTLFLRLDQQAFQLQRSLRVTDGLFMANSHRVVLATTARDLRFYHSATGTIVARLGLDSIVMCLDYNWNPSNPDLADMFFGDVHGNVTHLKFKQATSRQFATMPSNWLEHGTVHIRDVVGAEFVGPKDPLWEMGKVVSADTYDVHHEEGDTTMNQSVMRVKFIPKMEAFVTCSLTTTTAMVVVDLTIGLKKGQPREFNIPKGARCFDYCEELNLIATGGSDGHVRIWNPYVQQHANHAFVGHASPIIHVAFNAEYNQIISVADTEIIKIWSVTDRVCLNTLSGVIPHTMMFMRQPLASFIWHAPSQSVLTCSGAELIVLQLSRDDQRTSSKTAHSMPITCAAVIPEFKMICTGCCAGAIISWEIYTSKKVLEFANAHANAAVSCLEVGHGGRRLISGASNGDIFVWNVLSGIVLQKLYKKEPKEVTGVCSLPQCIYAIGWDGRLVRFADDEDVDIARAPVEMEQQTTFDPVEYHHDDVLTMAQCGSALLATGSFDGQVIIWNLKIGKAAKRFDSSSFRTRWRMAMRRQTSSFSTTETGGKDNEHFPNVSIMAKRSVEKLLWLKERVKIASKGKALNTATLVASCDGGCIAFWNAVKGDLLHAFYAVTNTYGVESIGGLSTDDKNERLFTGDSLGNVRVWDISSTALDGIDKRPPRLLADWAAHVQGISAITLLEDAGVLITCSSDCSARVWGMSDGHFIGAFGDSVDWSLSVHDSVIKAAEIRISESLSSQLGDHELGAPNKEEDDEDGVVTSQTLLRRATVAAADEVADYLPRSDSTGLMSETDVPLAKLGNVMHNERAGNAANGALLNRLSSKSIPEDDEIADDSALQPSDPIATEPTSMKIDSRTSLSSVNTIDAAITLGAQLQSMVSIEDRFGRGLTLPSLRRNNQLPTFKWERPSVLGKMFTKKATRKHAERKDKRKHHVKHAIMPSVTGLKVCNPYHSLKLSTLDQVQGRREPSAVSRGRTGSAQQLPIVRGGGRFRARTRNKGNSRTGGVGGGSSDGGGGEHGESESPAKKTLSVGYMPVIKVTTDIVTTPM